MIEGKGIRVLNSEPEAYISVPILPPAHFLIFIKSVDPASYRCTAGAEQDGVNSCAIGSYRAPRDQAEKA